MTAQDSTCTCQVCGTPYQPTLNKDGSPRRTKHSLCKARACREALRPKRQGVRGSSSLRGLCSSPDCIGHAVAKGYCSKHYARLRAHGDIGITLKPRDRVTKQCGWCGNVMSVRSSLADKRTACSRACANHIKARAAGYEHRAKPIVCAGCHSEVVRTVRTDRDSGRFCGRQCAFDAMTRLAGERAALRRIGERVRRALEVPMLVDQEAAMLRRISWNVKVRVKQCRACGTSHIRRAPNVATCSRACQAMRIADQLLKRELYKQSEAGRAAKRRAKAKRRAAIRGAEYESIDPIKVFERDQWRCHLCGIKTIRKLRGSTDDRAPELEHIVSLADGGSHTWGNVACSCRRCNRTKGAASFGQLGLGFAA